MILAAAARLVGLGRVCLQLTGVRSAILPALCSTDFLLGVSALCHLAADSAGCSGDCSSDVRVVVGQRSDCLADAPEEELVGTGNLRFGATLKLVALHHPAP